MTTSFTYEDVKRTCNFWKAKYEWTNLPEILMIAPQSSSIILGITKDIDLPNNVQYISLDMLPVENVYIPIIKIITEIIEES
jgi:hypothetical protein